MLNRAVQSAIQQSGKSVMLLGPRQTGKSTLLGSLNPDIKINLADEEVYIRFAGNPAELRSQVDSARSSNALIVFIDEVQRIPSILNTVQAIIDERAQRVRFLLSGSSARKLRRGKANLLPGRIHSYQLGPITPLEFNYAFDTKQILSTGTLPGILSETSETSKQKTLRSYAATYLKEEIQAESLSRNIEGFARFLRVVASWSSTLVDYSKLASLANVNRQTVSRYFEILVDTLVFHRLEPFSKSGKLRLVQHPKFCIFDVGVQNGLLGNFTISQDRKGHLFETMVVSQIYASLYAKDMEARLSYYLTESGAEVDLVLEGRGETFCIEIKSSDSVQSIDTRGFDSFKRFFGRPCQCFVFYAGDVAKNIDGIDVLPWQEGFRRIGL